MGAMDGGRAMRVVDLTVPIAGDYPHRPIAFETISTVAERGAAITRVTFDTHWGTHLDAPSHSLIGARTVERLDLARCCGPAHCLDLTQRGAAGSRIDVADLAPVAALVTPGVRLLLHTGWSRQFGSAAYHRDFPVLTVAAAAWLAERRIGLLGVDVPSVGPTWPADRTELIAVHQALLGAEIVIVECLTNLAALPAEGFTFVAAPLPFVGSDGSPVRALALVSGES
ncbi:MAG: cyclase family protein [Chloroflexi bacterium]|nr:cyclase family protein [Chloroflexota bacterium]